MHYSAVGIVLETNGVSHLIKEFLWTLLHEREKNVQCVKWYICSSK